MSNRGLIYACMGLIVFCCAGSCLIDSWHKKRIKALEAKVAELQEAEETQEKDSAIVWHHIEGLQEWSDELETEQEARKGSSEELWKAVNSIDPTCLDTSICAMSWDCPGSKYHTCMDDCDKNWRWYAFTPQEHLACKKKCWKEREEHDE